MRQNIKVVWMDGREQTYRDVWEVCEKGNKLYLYATGYRLIATIPHANVRHWAPVN